MHLKHNSTMASLDLKFRFPPHLLQKVSSGSSACINTTTTPTATTATATATASSKNDTPKTVHWEKGNIVIPMLSCIVLVGPLMAIG